MSNTTKRPVKISGPAHKAYADYARKWAGWRDLSLTFAAPDPAISPWAMTDLKTHAMTINADELVLSPKRVINTVTPFRLRQEAVMSGAIMHEAAHARFSAWMPRDKAQFDALRHTDGSKVSKATLALARLAEEPRIEGLMAQHIDATTPLPIAWVMRASAAHLLPTTALDTVDTDKQIMQLIQSWVLRAGRQRAIRKHAQPGTFPVRAWVRQFDETLAQALQDHTKANQSNAYAGRQAFEILCKMVEWDGIDPNLSNLPTSNGFVDEDDADIERQIAHPRHAGPYLLDKAKEVLTLLFPETGAEGAPEAGGSCGTSSGEQEQGQSGSESAEQGEGEGSGQSEDEKPGDGESEGAGSTPEWAKDLANAEKNAKTDAKTEEKNESAPRSMSIGGTTGGLGAGGGQAGGTRQPTVSERGLAKGAERFLRDLISPSESSNVVLTEAPSATVDPAALASWKAGGMTRDPRFFKRVTRNVEPSPPVKIAVLVDVSGSMDQMQRPSAVLSWALASAALDLRNFAGRGQQIESTLIHWGDSARVIVKNGQPVKGITQYPCNEGTSAMHLALDLVDREIPGFFDSSDDGKPSNRLLVQFTDWELNYRGRDQVRDRVHQMLATGVNMLSVVPSAGVSHRTLNSMTSGARIQRGVSRVLTYNPSREGMVWDEAARVLGH